jgi:dynein heavy chain 2
MKAFAFLSRRLNGTKEKKYSRTFVDILEVSIAMANGDVRKDYILSTVANYFSISASDGAITVLVNDVKLNNFLDDGNSLLLSAYSEMSDGGVKIHLDNAANVGLTENKVLVFFKSRPDVVTPENMHRDVLVSSMLDSPVSALYHALQKVYSPLLLKDAKWSNEFDPKLQVLARLHINFSFNIFHL